MNPKIFVGWAFAAVVFAIAAVAVAFNQPSISTVNLENEAAFPEVRDKANDVSKITITTGEGSFALTRKEDGNWVAPEKYDYPAASKKVRELIVTMADMKLVEPKTAQADRFTRLEVEDIDVEGSNSRLVRLETANGDVVAEAIFGKTRYRLTGRSESGTYIRRPGEQQAWLASGKVNVENELDDWLEKEIVHLSSDSVRRVELTPHGGQTYSAERTDKEGDFQVAGVPEGRKLKDGATNSLAPVLAYVDLKDVRPRGEFEMPAERHTARAATFDGVEVSVEFAKTDDANWAVFSARYVGDSAEESEEAKAARERAEEINDRVKDWAYQIADHVAARLSKPIEDLLEDEDKTS